MSATLTMLVHGEAGTGKSWLGNTAPAPRLILDAEGRGKYLPSALPKVEWDPRSQSPPVADGSWETCVAIVPDFDTLGVTWQWLQSGQHGFRSVVVDSLMEVQKRLIDRVAGMEQLKTQDWGEVLRRLESMVRNYRDLVLVPSNPVDCVVLTCGTKAGEDGRQRPLLQGQMSNAVPYYMDAVGYLYVTQQPEDPSKITRSLLVQPTPSAVAKDGTGRLPGPVIHSPDIGQMFALLDGQPVAATVPAPYVESAQSTTGGAAQ